MTNDPARISLSEQGILETTWHGKIDGPAMEWVVARTKTYLGEQRQIRYWFSDTSAVTTYAVDLRKPATELLKILKSRGLLEIVGVVPSAAIRMLSTSLTFVVGLKIKMFPTADEARKYLEEVARKAA